MEFDTHTAVKLAVGAARQFLAMNLTGFVIVQNTANGVLATQGFGDGIVGVSADSFAGALKLGALAMEYVCDLPGFATAEFVNTLINQAPELAPVVSVDLNGWHAASALLYQNPALTSDVVGALTVVSNTPLPDAFRDVLGEARENFRC